MDAHDPVGYNNARMPCGRKAELRSAILWWDRGAIAAGISGKGPGEIRWTASVGLPVRQIQRHAEVLALAFVDETIGSCRSWQEGLAAYRSVDSFEEHWKIEAGRWLLFARDNNFLRQSWSVRLGSD